MILLTLIALVAPPICAFFELWHTFLSEERRHRKYHQHSAIFRGAGMKNLLSRRFLFNDISESYEKRTTQYGATYQYIRLWQPPPYVYSNYCNPYYDMVSNGGDRAATGHNLEGVLTTPRYTCHTARTRRDTQRGRNLKLVERSLRSPRMAWLCSTT